MNKLQAIEICHTLSKPSKMPCKSYSIPASACKTGSKLRQKAGTVCSDCYACKGMYAFSTTQAALEKRLASLTHPDWVAGMVTLIGDSQYFRWHDSGDIQSVAHLSNIYKVAKLTPDCRHWLPTKEASLVKKHVKTFGVPENLVIRISAPMIDNRRLSDHGHENVVSSRSVTAAADLTGTHLCKAPLNNGKCGSCRRCWSPKVKDVAYLMH